MYTEQKLDAEEIDWWSNSNGGGPMSPTYKKIRNGARVQMCAMREIRHNVCAMSIKKLVHHVCNEYENKSAHHVCNEY